MPQVALPAQGRLRKSPQMQPDATFSRSSRDGATIRGLLTADLVDRIVQGLEGTVLPPSGGSFGQAVPTTSPRRFRGIVGSCHRRC